MKLTDLNPRWAIGNQWVGDVPGAQVHNQGNYWNRDGMGITFVCPVCKTHRLAVFFSNPVDGKPPQVNEPLWLRTGETFETLTLSPSVNAIQDHPPGSPDLGFGKCWHGFIQNGEII